MEDGAGLLPMRQRAVGPHHVPHRARQPQTQPLCAPLASQMELLQAWCLPSGFCLGASRVRRGANTIGLKFPKDLLIAQTLGTWKRFMLSPAETCVISPFATI